MEYGSESGGVWNVDLYISVLRMSSSRSNQFRTVVRLCCKYNYYVLFCCVTFVSE